MRDDDDIAHRSARIEEHARRHRLYVAAVVAFAAGPVLVMVRQRHDTTTADYIHTTAVGAGTLVVAFVGLVLASVVRVRRAAQAKPSSPYRGSAPSSHCERRGG